MADKFCDMEMITEAIKRCSERYGVDRSVIYRDCKKVTSLYNIRNFYYWVKCLLENMCGLCYDDVIYNIDIKYNANVKEVINKRLGIALK